jgi:23S rRNA pseudouridine1911/1915/1917 synthase
VEDPDTASLSDTLSRPASEWPNSETFLIDRSLPSERLDVYLRTCFPTLSRGALQRLIAEGNVRVNGKAVKATHHPRAGEQIQIQWPAPKPSQAHAEEMALAVLFEDENLLVLNKPPNLVVHPAAGHQEHTLVNALLHHCRGQLSGIGGVARPGIVHRLDKDTSGCMVIAKNDRTHLALATQFAQRQTRKLYLALVCGAMTSLSGEIRAGIARHPSHRKRMAVAGEGGRDAWTTYRVLERFESATLVEAQLHTGRTHQIRVHFHHIGFPLVGDQVYGKRPNQTLSEKTGYSAPRQMLHSSSLTFVHPASQKALTLQAPLPEDFLAALTVFRAR